MEMPDQRNEPPAASDHDDYVWRFAVEPTASKRGYSDPLVEMVRAFLEDFLNIGYFTCRGEPARVDGFAFTNDPAQVYGIFLDEIVTGDDSVRNNSSLRFLKDHR